MAMPRKFWVLIGWVIGLTTLHFAADVIVETYEELSALAGCKPDASATDFPVCQKYAYAEGAARLGQTIVTVPAVGLGLLAIAIGWSHQRKVEQNAVHAAKSAKTATVVDASSESGKAAARAAAKSSKNQRSKATTKGGSSKKTAAKATKKQRSASAARSNGPSKSVKKGSTA